MFIRSYHHIMPINFLAGQVLVFDKPYRMTSFALVSKVRWLLCRKMGVKRFKVGHAGTLDPLATGVLLLCTGRATKRIEELQLHEKQYSAGLRLGATTPSYDLEHEIDATFPYEHITRERLEEVLAGFEGDIEQTPPVFSACKIKGDRACDLARKGKEVSLAPKRIHISRIAVNDFRLPDVNIDVTCGKGTYIRSLARDIGEELDSGAHLTSLRRTRVGDYRVEDAFTIDSFEEWLNHQEVVNELPQ